MPQSTSPGPSKPSAQAAGFFRRLAATLYDSLLLIALFFAATAAALPFNHGKAFASDNVFYPAYLLFIGFLFYGWFWTHGGQTLGLRAWKLKVLTIEQHNPISWQQALIRYIAAIFSWAIFGLGFLWIFVDKNNRSWHDMLSKTTVYFVGRR